MKNSPQDTDGPSLDPRHVERALGIDETETATILLGDEDKSLEGELEDNLSQRNGQPGWLDMGVGNNVIDMAIKESAHGEMVIYGGRPKTSTEGAPLADTFILRSNDPNASLVRIDANTAQLVQRTAAGMVKITFEDVENITLQTPGNKSTKLVMDSPR